MFFQPGETKQLSYLGFAKLYKESGEVVGRVVIVTGLSYDSYSSIHCYLSTKTGKEVYSSLSNKVKETNHPNGFVYMNSFVDNMGNKYYIGKAEKSITIDF